MKIALAQINPTVGDFRGNLAKIVAFAERAAEGGADLVVFPELCICGYPPADLLERRSFVDRAGETLAELCRWTGEAGRPAVLVGTVLPADSPEGKHVRNVAVLLAEGRVVHVQQKMLLPFYDVFDEQRYFEPAKAQQIALVPTKSGPVPVAITICEDAWNDKGFWPRRNYAVDPVEELMRQWGERPEPRLLVNLSASPFWGGKSVLRREMLAAQARHYGAYVLMVNQVGGNDSLIFDGASFGLGPDGSVLAQAGSFVEDVVWVEVGSPGHRVKAGPEESIPQGLKPRVGGGSDGRAEALPYLEATAGAITNYPDATTDEVAEVWGALVLGTRDYVRKCGFSKALIGLSGGIDSALVAAIAVEALGAENVMGIGMPSEYSSEGSKDDARDLALRLGIRFEMLAIHDAFEAYMKTLDPLFAGTPFGLAEENLQSRIRGGLLMSVSNKFGALVLTTGNKSEMSTGYCTLYGDMVGALAVIGDVMKTKVYALSRYVNRERQIIPVATIEKPPSAELRPDQKDTDSLPPYEVLDPILAAYVERYESADEIAAKQGVDAGLVRQVIRLVERCEYKRQQAAPVLKVTQKSFGTGRRFPIAVKVDV